MASVQILKLLDVSTAGTVTEFHTSCHTQPNNIQNLHPENQICRAAQSTLKHTGMFTSLRFMQILYNLMLKQSNNIILYTFSIVDGSTVTVPI